MAISIPKLEIYYIEINERRFPKKRHVSSAIKHAATSPVFPGTAHALPGLVAAPMVWMGLRNLGITLTLEAIKSLAELIQSQRFYVITSKEELAQYENAHGNRWVNAGKGSAFKQKQYYVRHPKISNRNLLIEAKSFYDYIEEEQKEELIDFILSHCSAKSIQIDRVECISIKGKANANVEALDISAGVNYENMKGNYFSYKNPNGTRREVSRKSYSWISQSLQHSIPNLTDGGSLRDQYESDFTCGLSFGEAKTIGLDMSKHKKYIYTIQIDC